MSSVLHCGVSSHEYRIKTKKGRLDQADLLFNVYLRGTISLTFLSPALPNAEGGWGLNTGREEGCA